MIHIIGLGIGDISNLSEEARQTIPSCQLVIGSNRQQQLIKPLLADDIPVLHYPSPFAQLAQLLNQHKDKEVLLLASGDPLFFGIGAWLLKRFNRDQLQFYPNISSIQTAFSRIKQPWQQAKVISLHGRPLISIRPYLKNQRWYAILTDKNSQPKHIAQELQQQGFEQSKLWICEALGTDNEKIHQLNCKELLNNKQNFHALHITIIHIQGKNKYLPEFPGIEDKHFETGKLSGKGMITKKQLRLAALSLLQTQANDIAWDIGAGCGGLSVEWAFWHPHCQLYAIEHHKERLKYLKINREKFGVVKNLNIIADSAPKCLDALPSPNKIFIGGSNGGMIEILGNCWQHLKTSGCIVVSCVTEDCKYEVMQYIQQNNLSENIEILEIATSKLETLAGKQLLRPQLPVRLVKLTKR